MLKTRGVIVIGIFTMRATHLCELSRDGEVNMFDLDPSSDHIQSAVRFGKDEYLQVACGSTP